eukprot:scaffold74022_cov16-Tisochrysis_lutea.AAC.3
MALPGLAISAAAGCRHLWATRAELRRPSADKSRAADDLSDFMSVKGRAANVEGAACTWPCAWRVSATK